MNQTSVPAAPYPVRPSSTRPVADCLAAQRRGISPDGRYVVLPRVVLEQLPLPLQNRLAAVLAEVHQHLPEQTPIYRVYPAVWKQISSLAPEELREAGLEAELGADGEVVYRSATTGQPLTEQDIQQHVMTTVHDPLQADTRR
jgi:hypothetical protein